MYEVVESNLLVLKKMKQYISKHQHHKKSALNFHISKSTGHKNTRNQAPPFAIDLNENLIVYITHLVFTPNPPSRPLITAPKILCPQSIHTYTIHVKWPFFPISALSTIASIPRVLF